MKERIHNYTGWSESALQTLNKDRRKVMTKQTQSNASILKKRKKRANYLPRLGYSWKMHIVNVSSLCKYMCRHDFTCKNTFYFHFHWMYFTVNFCFKKNMQTKLEPLATALLISTMLFVCLLVNLKRFVIHLV